MSIKFLLIKRKKEIFNLHLTLCQDLAKLFNLKGLDEIQLSLWRGKNFSSSIFECLDGNGWPRNGEK